MGSPLVPSGFLTFMLWGCRQFFRQGREQVRNTGIIYTKMTANEKNDKEKKALIE